MSAFWDFSGFQTSEYVTIHRSHFFSQAPRTLIWWGSNSWLCNLKSKHECKSTKKMFCNEQSRQTAAVKLSDSIILWKLGTHIGSCLAFLVNNFWILKFLSFSIPTAFNLSTFYILLFNQAFYCFWFSSTLLSHLLNLPLDTFLHLIFNDIHQENFWKHLGQKPGIQH